MFASPGPLPNPGIESMAPTLQADSLPFKAPGKPKNTGVGSLSLLQQIFPTQESIRGLLHCRCILYQLSYQGSPYKYKHILNIIHLYESLFRFCSSNQSFIYPRFTKCPLCTRHTQMNKGRSIPFCQGVYIPVS